MKQFFLILITLTPLVLLGQETHKVTEQRCIKCVKEVYYVLKSDPKIRHGLYQKLGFKDVVLTSGYYKNGLKDSTWTQYDFEGKNKVNTGLYFQDKRVGLWEFYSPYGELEQKYDYTKDEISFFLIDENFTLQNCIVINGNNKKEMQLDRPPLYVGGTSAIFEFLLNKLHYPIEALDNGVSGVVYIALTVDSVGRTRNHRIEKGIGLGCNEEALRVVKQLPDNWFSGILNGEFVTAEIVLPITFTIR
jgi:TonB family protein